MKLRKEKRNVEVVAREEGVVVVINGNAYTFAYMIDSYNMWHARLGHTNFAYVFKLQRLGLINMHDNQTKECDVCVESKLTKPFVLLFNVKPNFLA